MEDQIRQIVSKFIGLPSDLLNQHTRIDRTAMVSSIVIHRMYAQLERDGYEIRDYTNVKTFGDLLNRVKTREFNQEFPPMIAERATAYHTSVGIDIELIAQMPIVSDFWQEPFYTQNFSPTEIAYCILQPDSFASFTGLFAAKEALVKADSRLRDLPFNQLPITHLPTGAPVFPGFQLSISHAGDYATAIAFPVPSQQDLTPPAKPSFNALTLLSSFAFVISFLALLIVMLKSC